MNRWTLVALLVGIGLGYLLSETLRPPERGRTERAPRTAPEPAGKTRLPTPLPDREAGPQEGRVSRTIAEPASDERVSAPDGEGFLRVDFTGLPDADPSVVIHDSDIEGRAVTEEHGAEGEDRRVDFAWREGTFRVTWRDAGAMHRCEAWVRIRAERATDVDASDPRYRLPEAGGLAALTVRVPAAGGGWRSNVEVHLWGTSRVGVRAVAETTNRGGYARFRVRAGDYTVRLGSVSTPVTLAARERRALQLELGRRGDVLIEPARPGEYWLADGEESVRSLSSRDGRALEVFVEEGDYDLNYAYRGRDFSPPPFVPRSVELGPIRVVAGQTTVFRHLGQPGAIELKVDLSEVSDADRRMPWSVRVGNGVPVPCEETDEVFARVARVRRIEPGPYEVRILCDGKTRFRETALVGFDSITPVEVVIRR